MRKRRSFSAFQVGDDRRFFCNQRLLVSVCFSAPSPALAGCSRGFAAQKWRRCCGKCAKRIFHNTSSFRRAPQARASDRDGNKTRSWKPVLDQLSVTSPAPCPEGEQVPYSYQYDSTNKRSKNRDPIDHDITNTRDHNDLSHQPDADKRCDDRADKTER